MKAQDIPTLTLLTCRESPTIPSNKAGVSPQSGSRKSPGSLSWAIIPRKRTPATDVPHHQPFANIRNLRQRTLEINPEVPPDPITTALQKVDRGTAMQLCAPQTGKITHYHDG